MGNSVIIELKRHSGSLGVDTQALQYLADFSRYKGQNFINHFSKRNHSLDQNIRGFLGDEVRTEDINKKINSGERLAQLPETQEETEKKT